MKFYSILIFDTASFRKQISSVTHLESSYNLFILVGFLAFKFVSRNPENISVYIFFLGSKMLFLWTWVFERLENKNELEEENMIFELEHSVFAAFIWGGGLSRHDVRALGTWCKTDRTAFAAFWSWDSSQSPRGVLEKRRSRGLPEMMINTLTSIFLDCTKGFSYRTFQYFTRLSERKVQMISSREIHVFSLKSAIVIWPRNSLRFSSNTYVQ